MALTLSEPRCLAVTWTCSRPLAVRPARTWSLARPAYQAGRGGRDRGFVLPSFSFSQLTPPGGRQLSSFRRHARLQLFEPVEDDAKFWGVGVSGLGLFRVHVREPG